MNATVFNIKLLVISLLLVSDGLFAACDDPTGLVVSSIGNNDATVSWNTVAGAENYRLAYRLRNNNRWISVLTTPNTSYNITGLNSGTPYQWGIRVLCANSEQSEFIFGDEFTTTGPAACAVPVNLNATALSETSINFAWDHGNGSTSYRLIYWKRDGLGNETDPSPNAQWVETSSNSAVVNNLQSGTSYIWTVRNICGGIPLQSELAVFSEVTTQGTIRCEDPTNMSATYLSATSVALSCDQANGATTYRFAYKESGTEEWIEVINTTNNTAQITIDPGLQYQWGIRVICDNDETVSRFAFGSDFSTQSPCEIPTNLRSRTTNSGDKRLIWDMPASANSSEVRYREVGTSTWTLVSSGNNRINISNLPADTNYEWQVRSVCSGSVSEYSELAFFNTSCDTPRNLRFVIRNTNRVILRWNTVNGASGYLVQYRVVGQSTWIEETPSSNRLRIDNVPLGITYEWRVRATCSVNSYFSPISEFSVPAGSGPAAANLRMDPNTFAPETIESIQMEFTAYPNPVVDILLVDINGAQGQVMARVFSTSGELMLEKELDSNGGSLDLSTFDTGIYLLHIITSSQVLTDKVIVNQRGFK